MFICGVDEAGRGPLAGPVVAAAVVLPKTFIDERIKDSKQLSEKLRNELAIYIKQIATAWAIVSVGARRIETLNILQATRLAMSLAVNRIRMNPDLVLIDGNQKIVCAITQQTVVRGDQLVVQISAASILAKTHRDQLMRKLAHKYPGYGLESHMGYPTVAHRQAIVELGPCSIHRKTFRGVLHNSIDELSIQSDDIL